MATSVSELVDSKVPWLNTLSTVDRPTPRPTWDLPPEPETLLDNRSENTVRAPLKPRVLVLARLLPMTLMAWELVFSPLTPLYSALVMPMSFSSIG